MPLASDAIFSPSQLNTLARDLLEGSFPLIWVEAELGNVARPASGHLYFTLKDARAQIRAAMFRPKSTWLKFVPREGMRVLARGRVTLYEARGEYQMVLEHMEEAGEGALRRAFEALKARLEAEGLFAAERKRSLPSFPRHLGVLTSPTGAAIQDVLSVLARRFPLLHVDILPIPVQGENAAAQIRQMLERAASSGRYDLLLLTRGGGSLEDLWAFNDEALARTIAASSVPVVSAIGHETDFTLADFAADLRAPTPSAAAEIITPDQAALAQRLARLGQRLGADTRHRLHGSMQQLDRLRLRLDAQSPGNRLALLQARMQQAQRALASRMGRQLQEARHHTRQLAGQLQAQAPARRLLLSRQRLASLEHRPLAALEHRLQLHRQHLALLAGRPQACLQQQIHWQSRRLATMKPRLPAAWQQCRRLHQEQLAGLARALAAVNPLATVERGYSILRTPDGHVLRSIEQAPPGSALAAEVSDGVLQLRVERQQPKPATLPLKNPAPA